MTDIIDRINQLGADYGKWLILAGTLVMTGIQMANTDLVTPFSLLAFAGMWVITTWLFVYPFDNPKGRGV